MAIWGRNKHFEPSVTTQAAAPQVRAGDLTVSDYANGMPNLRLSELFKSLMRQMKWFIPLFLIGAAGIYYKTKDLKRSYSGDGSIMVQLGEEYVYSPVGNATNGSGLLTTIDTITLTEAALMKNAGTLNKIIGEMTSNDQALKRFDSKIFEKIKAAQRRNDEAAYQEAYRELRKKVDNNYIVMPQPKSSIIDVMFKHEDPEVAVETATLFIDAYLEKRKTVFGQDSGDRISERRKVALEQLKTNERAIARFLTKNNVSDFASEQTGLRKRTEDLKAALNLTRANIAEAEASLALVEDQLRATPETINLYRDDTTSQRVAQAELELRQLLAKYLPTSNPVRQKEAELNELRRLQSAKGGEATGGRRVGPNPVQQTLVTRRNTLAATADSLREKEFTLQRQLNSADAKIRRLTNLTPEYQNLLRERDTVNTRLTSYDSREQEALVDAQQAEDSAENVTVISWPEFATKGRDTAKLMFVLGALGWGVLLGFFALFRIFLDPRLYAVPSRLQSVSDVVAMPETIAVPEPAPLDIPEAVPAYAPAAFEPQYYADPYVTGGDTGVTAAGYLAADPYAQTQAYGTYADPQGAQMAYDPQAAYDSMGQAPGAYDPAIYGQPAYDPNFVQPGYAGNAALAVQDNPYMSGDVRSALGQTDLPTPPPAS